LIKSFARLASQILRAVPVWGTLLLILAAAASLFGTALGRLPAWAAGGLDWLSSFAAVFLAIFIEAAPFLLLGSIASGMVEVFIGREDILRWAPRTPFWGALAGSLLGLFFPVGECGVVPLTRRLISKGVPVSAGMAFLLAGPVINPIVIASTLAAFGPGALFWGRLGLSLAIAVLTGLVFSLLRPSSAPLLWQTASPPAETPPAQARPPGQQLRRAVVIAADEFFEMGRYLVIGAALAAAAQTVVPQPALLNLGRGPVLSAAAMTGLAVLLSAGPAADAFIALAFTSAFTGGSLLAFLVFGSMVDIKNALMYLRVFGPRAAACLILLPFMLTLIFAVSLNYFAQGW